MTFSIEENTKLQVKRWLVLLLSPTVWTLCFGLIYLLDEAVCGLHFWRWFVWNEVTAVIPVMLLLLLFTLGVTVGNAYVGWKIWHDARSPGTDDDAAERDRFIGAASLMLGSLFALLTLALAAVILWLQPC